MNTDYKQIPTPEAEFVNEDSKHNLIEALRDDQVKEAIRACGRTAINCVVSVIDMIPIAGEAVSWSADAAKFAKFSKVARFLHLDNFDLSPDVPIWAAVGSEFGEAPSGTLAPSHLIETTWQFKADRPRIKAGIDRWRQLRSGD